ncbi:TMV resistance protein N-like protein, partial [Tanacetum coccineum]
GRYEIIDQIVRKILGNRGRESNLIGIESHMDALDALLDIEATTEVRVVVIYGMGGIGKTTIAQALFRRIAYKFAGSSFIKDVRENSSTKTDICALQEKILGDILMARHYFFIEDPLQERFVNKKVLLVLDDVDDVKQLEFLAATRDWFGPGSRIIITTRDMHLLSDANAKYEPALLRMDQAVELFSRHAFRKNSPPEGYKELSDRAIGYTRRLPLALNILGSYFRGRKASVWESALDRIAEIPNSEIFKILKLSFDDLNLPEQQILLDIACFFKGGKVKDVSRWLDSFGFDPVIGISVLVERSLITVTKETLGMHDLIQEMCWKIVGESAPGSRLWSMDVVRDLIEENRELEVIEGISVIKEFEDQGFRADVFESMKNLRLLNVSFGFTCDEPTLLPDELRWLCWNYYPFSSLPVADMCKLVGLEMECNTFEHLWEGHKLIRFPDVSGAPNVERLILWGCHNLEEVHESLGFLKRLIYLDMNQCWNLKSLPSRLEMESLETLILSSCHFLERFPELSPCMVKLSHIDLTDCSNLEQLPSSIKYLSNLSRLDLSKCESLQNIPNSISELNCIKSLDLRNCWELQNLPDEFGRLENLQRASLLPLPRFRFLFTFGQSYHQASTTFRVLNCVRPAYMRWRRNLVNAGWEGEGAYLGLMVCVASEEMQIDACLVLDPRKQDPKLPRRLYNEPIMELRFENDGMHVPKPQIDASSKSEKGNLWIGYVPLSLLETIDDDGEDFQTKDWSHVIEGNLVIKISNRKEPAIRCGVLVVFKEVELTQQTKPSYYQNWKLSQIYPNTYRCE